LVHSVEPIYVILKTIKSQLNPELVSAINPVAFIEGQEFKLIEAINNLVDRFVQQNLSKQKTSAKQEVMELKEKLEDLKNSCSDCQKD
jgi:hypothetical protein